MALYSGHREIQREKMTLKAQGYFGYTHLQKNNLINYVCVYGCAYQSLVYRSCVCAKHCNRKSLVARLSWLLLQSYTVYQWSPKDVPRYHMIVAFVCTLALWQAYNVTLPSIFNSCHLRNGTCRSVDYLLPYYSTSATPKHRLYPYYM